MGIDAPVAGPVLPSGRVGIVLRGSGESEVRPAVVERVVVDVVHHQAARRVQKGAVHVDGALLPV